MGSAFYALAVDSRLTVALFAALLGFFYGSSVGVFSTYLGDLYGVVSLPILMGVVGIESAAIGSALGPWLFGTIYDRMQSYDLAFIIAGIFAILGLIGLTLIKPPVKRKA